VSIGYKGVALPGIEQWFDERSGVLKNMGGKVDDATASLGGLYVSGWLKRGPSGIIGTNIMDAKDTVVNVVKDLEGLESQKGGASENLLGLLKRRGVPVVTWSDFERINAEETRLDRKRSDKQPREKITDVEELLKAAFS
jgi:NADPH-dependent glutamate synthase beta subunit-like oxidoreductase